MHGGGSQAVEIFTKRATAFNEAKARQILVSLTPPYALPARVRAALRGSCLQGTLPASAFMKESAAFAAAAVFAAVFTAAGQVDLRPDLPFAQTLFPPTEEEKKRAKEDQEMAQLAEGGRSGKGRGRR